MAGVGPDSVEHAIAAGTKPLAHAWMHSEREPVWMSAEIVDGVQDGQQPVACYRPRTRLSQPTASSAEVSQRRVGVAQLSRQETRSTTGVWDRQLVVGIDALDPGSHRDRIDQPACSDIGIGRSDAFGLPGKAVLPLGFGFRAWRLNVVDGGWNSVHGPQDNRSGRPLPVPRRPLSLLDAHEYKRVRLPIPPSALRSRW